MTRPAPKIAAELRAMSSGLVPYAEKQLMQEAADRIDALVEDMQHARQGLFRCHLCGQYAHPVNHHDDCAPCAKAQYGDE